MAPSGSVPWVAALAALPINSFLGPLQSVRPDESYSTLIPPPSVVSLLSLPVPEPFFCPTPLQVGSSSNLAVCTLFQPPVNPGVKLRRVVAPSRIYKALIASGRIVCHGGVRLQMRKPKYQ